MRSIKVLKNISFICAQIKATVVYRFSFINQRRENKSALQTKTKKNISTMSTTKGKLRNSRNT